MYFILTQVVNPKSKAQLAVCEYIKAFNCTLNQDSIDTIANKVKVAIDMIVCDVPNNKRVWSVTIERYWEARENLIVFKLFSMSEDVLSIRHEATLSLYKVQNPPQTP